MPCPVLWAPRGPACLLGTRPRPSSSLGPGPSLSAPCTGTSSFPRRTSSYSRRHYALSGRAATCPAPGEAKGGQRATRPRAAGAPAVCPTNSLSDRVFGTPRDTAPHGHSASVTHATQLRAWALLPVSGVEHEQHARGKTGATLPRSPPSPSQGPWLSPPTGLWCRGPSDTANLESSPWVPQLHTFTPHCTRSPTDWLPCPPTPCKFGGSEHGLWSQPSGFKSQLCHFLTVCPWASSFASLCLSLLVYKTRIRVASISQGGPGG